MILGDDDSLEYGFNHSSITNIADAVAFSYRQIAAMAASSIVCILVFHGKDITLGYSVWRKPYQRLMVNISGGI